MDPPFGRPDEAAAACLEGHLILQILAKSVAHLGRVLMSMNGDRVLQRGVENFRFRPCARSRRRLKPRATDLGAQQPGTRPFFVGSCSEPDDRWLRWEAAGDPCSRNSARAMHSVCMEQIRPEDLVIDEYRSSLNDHAVRITHLPSGVSVSSDDGPTREQNYAVAMQRLREALDD